MREIRPIAQLGNRVQEAGKLRMGVKTAKAMKAIDHWRFTSPHHDCIEELAGLYGGTPKPWSDPKATQKDQWELLSTSSTIEVHVPPGGLSTWYEVWAGSGNSRRCDGVKVTIPSRNPDEDVETLDCLCEDEGIMECKPYSRLTVVLANVTFRGVWTLTTKSWNAADELRAMEKLIDQVQARQDIVKAELSIEPRSRMTRSGKRNFVVPTLSIPHTMEALASGHTGLGLGAGVPARRELEAGTPELEVVDAQLIHTAEDVLDEVDRVAALQMIADAKAFAGGIALGVSGATINDITKLSEDQLRDAMDFLDDVASEAIMVTGINDAGRLLTKRRKR